MVEEKKGNGLKNILDRISKLEFEFSRVKVMAEGVPTMVVESTARDVKVLRVELGNAVARNNELEGIVAELRVEMEEMKAVMEAMKSQGHGTMEGGGKLDAHQRNNVLSVSVNKNLQLTDIDTRWMAEDSAHGPLRLDGHTP